MFNEKKLIIYVSIACFLCEEVKLSGGVIYGECEYRMKKWTKEIGDELYRLSMVVTRRNRLSKEYEATKVEEENATHVVAEIAEDIGNMMRRKELAVKRIAAAAEEMARTYSNDEDVVEIDYFNADNLQNCKVEHCNYDDYKDYRRRMDLYYDEHFRTKVNTNHSVVKVATNIYERDEEVLRGASWSEGLDIIFKENFKNDTELTWQYFASPLGFMRHYPAIKWSQERYTAAYDFRMRSWYSEAFTSPKDIIILLDRSGSMTGIRRKTAAHTVNEILDTLNDNDFVNIYTFTNSTEPLVDCFNDTLVQANEENLRLLRESLPTFKIEFASDILIGLGKAFEILKKFRDSRTAADCNQAVMLITEGIDYDYQKETFFKKFNGDKHVRIFTYLIGNEHNDANEMGWIACNNRGYYVNITLIEEIREKVLKYLTVMSRPVNMKADYNYVPVWSYLYVDLADRRQTNWLWKKLEGIRQREVFLDFAKRQMIQENWVFGDGIKNHMLLMESHPYQEYEKIIPEPFDYMTTVSVPVFDKRENKTELLGVAGIDVPIVQIKSLIPYHRLGVNAYAFILTNNGYILMHPDLRTEFQNILKPTFNRVDMTEVEILDDENGQPRLFNKSVVELRRLMVEQVRGNDTLSVIDHMDKMRRILKYTRRYYFDSIAPFSLVIALPDYYGFNTIKFKDQDIGNITHLEGTGNYSIHPDWVYCKGTEPSKSNRENFLDCAHKEFPYMCKCNRNLTRNLKGDAKLTAWFKEEIVMPYLLEKYGVQSMFLATHSGLTRWKSRHEFTDIRTIDEPWYKRAVELYVNHKDRFIYSVPFEIIGYENNTFIRVSGAVFSKTGNIEAPAVVTGFQFNQSRLYDLLENVTMHNENKYKCGEEFQCFILDDNAYVVLSDHNATKGNMYTGNFIGDIRSDIMWHLVNDGIYKPTKMFDYQGICYDDPKQEKSFALKLSTWVDNIISVLQCAVLILVNFVDIILSATELYQSDEESTWAWERLAINKTVPTPCDKEMTLFTFGPNMGNEEIKNKLYIARHIEHSNLLLLAIINQNNKVHDTVFYDGRPNPTRITSYDMSLPCYIATKNNYTRKSYMKCFNEARQENNLNKDLRNCGGSEKDAIY